MCEYGFVVFFKQKTAYEMRISDWSSDVCSSDLRPGEALLRRAWLAADRCDTAIDRGNRGDHHELLRQARRCRGVMAAAASPAVANQLMAAKAPALVLASASTARAKLLAAAGLVVQCQAAAIDELSVKASLKAEGATPAQVDRKSTRLNSSH